MNMKPYKVLFVAHSSKLSGGANRSLLSVMTGLRDLGVVEPHVLMPQQSGALEDACKIENIPVYHAPYRTCCTVYKHDIKDVARWARLLVAPAYSRYVAHKYASTLPDDFDLIYSNERVEIIGAYLAKIKRVPHIWHVRTFAKENATYYSPFYTSRIKNGSDKIILISHALYDWFAKRIGESKLVMIHNGVDIQDYMVTAKEPHEGCRLLLTGRMVPTKEHMDAIRALEIVSKATDYPFELYFAGDVPSYITSNYKSQLQEYVAKAGLQDRVHFLGDVDDMAALRSRMDIELVCSCCEAFGRVTVEAMCAGLTVIGANTCGTMDIVEHEISGLLYEPHDAQQMAQHILWCVEHPEESAALAKNGQRRAAECFSIDATVRHVAATIRQVMKDHQK